MRLIRELEGRSPISEIFRKVYREEDAVFLDSSLQNGLGRYSVIGLHSYLKLVKGEEFTVNGVRQEETFENFVRRYLKEHGDKNETGLPIVSGAIGYFSYDYGRKKEGVQTRHSAEVCIPDCILNFYDDFIIQDGADGKLYLIANGNLKPAEKALEELEKICRDAQTSESVGGVGLASELQGDCGMGEKAASGAGLAGETQGVCRMGQKAVGGVELAREPQGDCGTGQMDEGGMELASESQGDCGTARISAACAELSKSPDFRIAANFEKEAYKQAVQDMIQYIIEGDIYIANMTQHLQITSPKEPWEVFEYLRGKNPSPFGGYLNYDDFQIVSASPERFLRMQNGHVCTRPIKGTRKRGATPAEDRALRQELESSEKDKSELLMIVDLERNDLNRVCLPGSVKVTELFTVEEYATVFHLVSNVEGDLAPEMTVMDLLEAAFPGGSITGAPKLRAMEIIDELEHSQRNLYTGSIGYLTLDGCCDFNIVIRTALYKDGVYYLGVGGGITCESELEFEYEETLQKAKALLEALKP
ncbi:MAG: aminodeoxychorismate synthase component I [Eubacteriales bacterium]|nr:aminodeoxychorismate synthase component I [Eubacteriales bacterium]